jgi:hypothetical protein
LKPCKIYYPISEENKKPERFAHFTVPCKCALDGNNTGFCGSIIGTPEYALALTKLKNMYEKSSCHTFDRNNFEA